MEDEKKKKRNKKKKNKQTKQAEDIARGADENHVSNEDNNHSEVLEMAELQNGGVDLSRHHHHSNGTEGAILAEAEKQQLLQRKVMLEEIVKQLQNEKDSYLQKEATLQETVKQLRKESDSYMEKVTTLEEKIKQLQRENDLHIHKEDALEQTIKQLRNEKNLHMQKEGSLEMSIVNLQSEKSIWLQKEADFEGKIRQLADENAALNFKGASLEEKIELLQRDKDSWIQMKNISKDTITSLNDDITQLKMQVVVLEESRNSLIKENQQLNENVSSLQLQLQNLENSVSSARSSDEIKKTSEEDFNTQIEAACRLVDKLISENVELVEKVNDLSVKLDRQTQQAGLSSGIGSDPSAKTIINAEPISESSVNMPMLSHNLESPEIVEVKDGRNTVNNVHAEPLAFVPNPSEADDSGEIVQIPLDDNEVQDLESQAGEMDEKTAVPLSDAPLVGAPFRLISFVAKYVSGADLVENSSNVGS
ncbi:putative leucine-rich repeat-containing protein DDB_G0290503 isoform X2 [Pistacia vera]|uniref:putative leucine-rich repeat-containing protein DDB_G0290503 isoform X2 n=1 Tax=Pistacia vera TaxID=55513 RepID=UPI00126380B5|nr:putative leucine-rich repeat-containing protein DDB_G0290503 isoform X2 [Pistacia vera]